MAPVSISPHSEGMRRRDAPDRRDVAAEERNGHEQPVAFTVRQDISTCLSSNSAATRDSTQHPHATCCNEPEPTTAVKYSRATNYREHSHSRVEPRRVRRRTIYCRASAETESFMLAGRREVIEYAGSRVLARR